MKNALPLGCIFMACGLAKRFQSNKLLTDFRGKPMVETIFSQFPSELFHQTIVVTRYPQVAVSAAIAGFGIVENDSPLSDISQTIQLGLQALRPEIEGCLFAVCDQPLLRPASIQNMVQTFHTNPQKIIALGVGTQRGNPVLFPKRFFDQLSQLPAHKGGSAVIEKHPEDLLIVQAQDPREVLDIDYPDDLEALSD